MGTHAVALQAQRCNANARGIAAFCSGSLRAAVLSHAAIHSRTLAAGTCRHTIRSGRMAVGYLGCFRSPRGELSCDVAGQQRGTFARLPYVSNARSLNQLLVGGVDFMGRGMAQQSPRVSVLRAPWAALVRDRSDLVECKGLGRSAARRSNKASGAERSHAKRTRIHPASPEWCRPYFVTLDRVVWPQVCYTVCTATLGT